MRLLTIKDHVQAAVLLCVLLAASFFAGVAIGFHTAVNTLQP